MIIYLPKIQSLNLVKKIFVEVSKHCKFTKYELAKYYNSCCEVEIGGKLL